MSVLRYLDLQENITFELVTFQLETVKEPAITCKTGSGYQE
jgi:hypothetical protein